MAGVDPTALLDKHPSAYKDINEVMAAQSDLVTVDHVLHQVLNYKGTQTTEQRHPAQGSITDSRHC